MENVSLLGISMAARSRRRWLVALVYGLVIVATAGLQVLFREEHGFQFVVANGLLVLLTLISHTAFRSVARQAMIPNRKLDLAPMVLSRPMPFAEPELDEREISVRNRAYFHAFRTMAIYAMALWLAVMMAGSGMISMKIMQLLFLPLIAMAFTLPQAVILWMEPDQPTPDQEEISLA